MKAAGGAAFEAGGRPLASTVALDGLDGRATGALGGHPDPTGPESRATRTPRSRGAKTPLEQMVWLRLDPDASALGAAASISVQFDPPASSAGGTNPNAALNAAAPSRLATSPNAQSSGAKSTPPLAWQERLDLVLRRGAVTPGSGVKKIEVPRWP